MNILEELDRAGAVYQDRHFIYKKGGHGPQYIDMDKMYPDVRRMLQVSSALVNGFNGSFDVVAGPATGGVSLATYVGTYMLRHGRDIEVVWADKQGEDGFVFERAGYAERIRGKHVLVVEDLLTTGSSVRAVCEQVVICGGEVLAVSAVCNRGGVTEQDIGHPLQVIAEVNFVEFAADACPLCAANVPIVRNIGHGARYMEAHPDYPGGYYDLAA